MAFGFRAFFLVPFSLLAEIFAGEIIGKERESTALVRVLDVVASSEISVRHFWLLLVLTF